MADVPGNDRSVPGRRVLVVTLGLVLLFAAVMFYGTQAFAKWSTPYLKARFEKSRRPTP
jgi:hypothetical protein